MLVFATFVFSLLARNLSLSIKYFPSNACSYCHSCKYLSINTKHLNNVCMRYSSVSFSVFHALFLFVLRIVHLHVPQGFLGHSFMLLKPEQLLPSFMNVCLWVYVSAEFQYSCYLWVRGRPCYLLCLQDPKLVCLAVDVFGNPSLPFTSSELCF